MEALASGVAVSRSRFIQQFPEFANTDASVVESMLAAAELEIDRDVWNEKADQGQMYLAAHKLALSPFGNSAQLVAKGTTVTVYLDHYERLVRQVSSGFRVA